MSVKKGSDLELNGQWVVALCFDAAITLRTNAGTELKIETTCSLKTHERAHVIDPTNLGDSCVVLLEQLNQSIATSHTSDAGDLVVRFSKGSELTVSPDDYFEAWTLNEPNGRLVVCLPGGGLTVWGG